MQKNKIKKDKLFVMILAVVVAGLAYHLIRYLWGMLEASAYNCMLCYAVIVGNIIAIIACLWLLQNYRKRRRLEQEKQEQETKELESPKQD